MKKENNSRQYPGETCRNRPDRAAERRSQATARQDKIDLLTPQQRLENLDLKFGVGKGAKKERVKLATLATKPVVQKTSSPVVQAKATTAVSTTKYEELEMQTLPDDVMEEIAALNEESGSKKKLKAKERRARESNNG